MPSDTYTLTISDAGVSIPTDGSVTTSKIADLNVTTNKIADGAITSAKIADGTIVSSDMAPSAVVNSRIADLNVTTNKIADGAITSAKIADGTIASDNLAAGAVTTAKILDLNVTTGKIANNNVSFGKIVQAPANTVVGNATASTNNLSTHPCSALGFSMLAATQPATARAHLELGSMSLQDDNDVIITGGSISGVLLSGLSVDTPTLIGVLPVANGGTNLSSYAVGDIVFASGATALSKLPDVATGNVLLSGGVDVAPSYGKVALSGAVTHVTGTLPIASGGTGQQKVVRGQISKMDPFTAVAVNATNTYVPVANAGTLAAAENMTLGASGTFSLKNTSDVTRMFRIYASVDATSANNQILGIKLAVGVGALALVDETECRAFTSGTNAAAKLVTSWMIGLAPNAEVAIYVANHSGTDSINIQRARLIAEAIL